MQIAKAIFHKDLSVMKKILDLGEFKFGKDKKEFQYFKKQIMDFTYKGLQKFFKQLVNEKILINCKCNAKLRHGYSDCEFCGGCGYKNK